MVRIIKIMSVLENKKNKGIGRYTTEQRTEHLGTAWESVNETLPSLRHPSSPSCLFIYSQEWPAHAKRVVKSDK